MEKHKIVLFTFLIKFLLFVNTSYCQTFSESDIKKLSHRVNRQIKGVVLGDGIKVRGCISLGRTLIYQYDVTENWTAPNNIKDEIISNLKTSGDAKTFFSQNIDVNFYYYKGNSISKKVSIKSNEFSIFNFPLGEYISINNHPKAKGVNLKIKAPVGWEVKEGNRPNIVKMFVNDGNTYLILIKNNVTFYSRKQIQDMFKEEKNMKEFVQEASSFLKNPQIIDHSIVTIDNYTAVQFKVKGKIERTGIIFSVIFKSWVVFYEDKIVFFQSVGTDNDEFKSLEKVYAQITNSIIFPDQYN
jgi:hypothetical protein